MAEAMTPRELEAAAEECLARGAAGEALGHLQTIINQGAADEYVWCYAGDALCALGEFAQAIPCYEEALARVPDQPELHVNISRPLYCLGEAEAAAAHLAQAIPKMAGIEALLNLAAIAPNVPGYSLRRVYEIRAAYGAALADPEMHPSVHYANASELASVKRAPTVQKPEGRPLRIGYLSAHFAQPAYMGPVWALINHHDRERFNVVLLSDAPVQGAFADYAPHSDDLIVDVSAMDDAALKACIAEQDIDILIDLSGYSYKSRLSLFAKRVAPVTAAWFNSYATTGLPGIDYIIGDAQVALDGEDEHYSEQVMRLPQSYLTFIPWEDRPPVAPPPCADDAPFTVGSLVSLYKVTGAVLDAWARILDGAPEARLLIANSDLKSERNKAYLFERMTQHGIDTARVETRPPAPHAEFIRYYDAIDLALDAFPYSGGTTTMEAVWQGVPVVSQAGKGWAARTTGTILHDTHLRDFYCEDVDSYVALAVRYATDKEKRAELAALRPEMRERLRATPALDGAGLARHMEALYRQMISTAE